MYGDGGTPCGPDSDLRLYATATSTEKGTPSVTHSTRRRVIMAGQ